jgi:hypothetical protein
MHLLHASAAVQQFGGSFARAIDPTTAKRRARRMRRNAPVERFNAGNDAGVGLLKSQNRETFIGRPALTSGSSN